MQCSLLDAETGVPGPLQRKVFVCLGPRDSAPSGPLGAPEAFCGATSACRGSGTRGANPRPLQHAAYVCPRSGDLAPSGPPLGPDVFCGATSVRRA